MFLLGEFFIGSQVKIEKIQKALKFRHLQIFGAKRLTKAL
jgi:hypothetical protein